MVHVPRNKIELRAVRASGPGGQGVNKRATKVRARIALADLGLTDAEERLVRTRLANRVNARGEVEVVVEDSRSQVMNRGVAIARLGALITGALRVRAKRVPTRVPRHAKEARLAGKRRVSVRKRERRRYLTEE
jgi:ribosome-associated protein